MSELYETITECLLNGAPAGQLAEILSEEIVDKGDQGEWVEDSYQGYMLKIEEFLDDADIYAFDGWEEAELIGHPHISRFWVVCDLLLPKKTDLQGGLRLIGKDNENRVLFKKKDHQWIVRLKILKRTLDEIQKKNQGEAQRRAKEQVKM